MTRRDLMEFIIKYAFWGKSSNQTIGIVVPSFAEAKQFTGEFTELLYTIPSFIRPKLHHCTIRNIQFDNNFNVRVLYNDSWAIGTSLNELYASSKMTKEQMAPYCFSVITIGTYTTFEDV